MEFPEKVTGLNFIEPIAEGASGCTFKVLNPMDNQLYALRIERVDPEIENKYGVIRGDINRHMYISNDLNNPFQLRFKYAYVIFDNILPPVITNLMMHSCPKRYEEWSTGNDRFIGTYSMVLMELGSTLKNEAIIYGNRHIQQYLFGLCFAAYRLHWKGVLHRDIRPPNVVMKTYSRSTVNVEIENSSVGKFSYTPMEGKIPCLIDFDISLLNPKLEPFMYLKSDYLEKAETLYGPTYILQTHNELAKEEVWFTYSIDYWMIGLTAMSSIMPRFWAYYTKRYDIVPKSVRNFFSYYSKEIVGILWSMANLSVAMGALQYIHIPVLNAIDPANNPFQEVANNLNPQLRSLLAKFFTWSALVISPTEILMDPYFESLRIANVCVQCGKIAKVKCLDCPMEENVYCSSECHLEIKH